MFLSFKSFMFIMSFILGKLCYGNVRKEFSNGNLKMRKTNQTPLDLYGFPTCLVEAYLTHRKNFSMPVILFLKYHFTPNKSFKYLIAAAENVRLPKYFLVNLL